MKNFLKKILKGKNINKDRNFKEIILPKISKFQKTIKENKTLSFLHYGHLGDIINSLPVIKELSKTKKCNLYIKKNHKIPDSVISKDHPFGEVYLSENAIKKLLPLLKNQNFLHNVEIYNDRDNIDIDLNFFRKLPINFNIDSVRWYSHLTGVFPNFSESYLEVPGHKKFENYIVIMRSLRRQNNRIDYSFLSSYEKLVFIGLKNEYEDLKDNIVNLEYFDSEDFLELASIIRNSKMFIGNLSFGYALAEAIKIPRLLESAPDFPLVYPNGPNAFDFYFQTHFEDLVKKLSNN